MKTIIIIDDDAIVRESLHQILENKGYEVIGTGKSADDAIRLYAETKPDLVLMDIRMTGKNGIEASQEILHSDSSAKILLLTTFHDKEYIDKAIDIGCKGYILKENIMSITASIEAVLNGKIVFDSKIIEVLSSSKPSKEIINRELESELSDRELSILSLVANGMNNKEISAQLFLSEGTVRNYISQMLSKLGLRDRTQLAIYYYKNRG